MTVALLQGMDLSSSASAPGVSDESDVLRQAWSEAQDHYEVPTSRLPVERRFFELAENWRRECGISSSWTDMVLAPSYQGIIALGAVAVPLILRELNARPDHWFWALTALTGANPIPKAAAGDLNEMTEAWLQWGRRLGYLA